VTTAKEGNDDESESTDLWRGAEARQCHTPGTRLQADTL
jgi:hypothetical protein